MRGKFKILIVFVIMFMCIFLGANEVKAIPDSLGWINQNGDKHVPGFGGGKGTHIKYSSKESTVAFCTHYQDDSPARLKHLDCRIINDYGDRGWRPEIRAGVGAIIRASSGQYSWDQADDTYASAEFAINKFLYYYNGYDGKNAINQTAFDHWKVNEYYNKAVEAYNNYQAYINLSSNSLRFSKEGNNYVSNWISVSSNAEWSLNTSRGRIERSGNSFRVIVDASSLSAGTTYSVKVNLSGSRQSAMARNYRCDDTHQTITPDIVEYTKTYADASASGSFTIPNPPGNLRIKVVDNDTSRLIGPSTVILYKGSGCSNYYKTINIGSSGSYTEYSLSPGYYSIEQIQAPSGYDLNTKCVSKYVYSDSTSDAEIRNNRSKGDLIIDKVDAATGEKITNSSATFYLYTNNYCTSYYSSFSTNSTGSAQVSLPIGTYYFREEQAPAKYNGDKTCYQVNITKGSKVRKTIKNEKKTGTLDLYKLDSNTNSKISGIKTVFKIYEGNSCNVSGGQVYEIYGNEKIILPIGNYAIKETKAPTGYIGDQSCHYIKINENEVKEEIFKNDKDCELKLGEKTPSQQQDPLERIKLFEYYKEKGITYNNLLNFKLNYDENYVKNSCSNVTVEQKLDIGCVSAKTTINIEKKDDIFDSKNLSAYSDTMKLTNNGKEYTGYCNISFELLSNLDGNNNYRNSYSYTDKHSFGTNIKSGQMILNREESLSDIAKGKVAKTCYFYGLSSNSSYEIQNKDKSMLNYENYVSSIELIADNEDSKKINVIKSEIEVNDGLWQAGTDTGAVSNDYLKLTRELTAVYSLKPVNAMNGTGKTNYEDCTECKKLGYGFVSAFTKEGNFSVPFKINVTKNLPISNNKLQYTATSDKCTYTSKKEVIDTPDNPPGVDPEPQRLNIEFRPINTNNPFPGKSGSGRTVGSNWCDENKNCSYKNNLSIQKYITNAENSYSRNTPKYRITLTPQTIEKIRKEDNATQNYDNYGMKCDSEGKNCESEFLKKYSSIIVKKA